MTKLSQARVIPLMVLLLATVSGCATYEKCGFEGCPSDQKTTAKVEAVFRQHPELGTRVGVQTSNHGGLFVRHRQRPFGDPHRGEPR